MTNNNPQFQRFWEERARLELQLVFWCHFLGQNISVSLADLIALTCSNYSFHEARRGKSTLLFPFSILVELMACMAIWSADLSEKLTLG